MGKLSVKKKEVKKDKIIEKSMELFCEKGYRTTKVEEITKALGISKGNFYTYFGSKEEVLYEILNIMKNERIKMLEEIDTDKTPKEVLRDFIEDYSQIFFKYGLIFEHRMSETLYSRTALYGMGILFSVTPNLF